MADTEFGNGARLSNYAMPVASALRLPDIPLPIDPYVLGAWLGDGTSASGGLTAHPNDQPHLRTQIERAGYRTTIRSTKYGVGTIGLHHNLRALGVLGNKHVPAIYLRAGHDQRLALLQGLMDTDGTVSRVGVPEFCNTNRRIIDAVYELIVSLGWRAYIKEYRAKLNGEDMGPCWKIKWSASEYVFTLPRKRDKQRLATRRTTKFRYVRAVLPCRSVPMRCITVGNITGLFLAGRSMLVTHNSAALVAMPLRWVHLPHFHALVLRRETPQLKDLWAQAKTLYKKACPEVKINNSDLIATFPSGATVWFTHCENSDSHSRFDGHSYGLVAFDELTHFTEEQYTTICACLRGPDDLPKCVRATTNPGSAGHDWVLRRWGPWLDPEYETHAAPGEKLWYVKKDGETTWVDKGTPGALSRCFIPARVSDNPHAGAAYKAQLEEIADPVRRAQLRDGNWTIKPGAGLYFKRTWIHTIDGRNPCVRCGRVHPIPEKWKRRVRYWDRASTEAKATDKKGKDPDWTVGGRMIETETGYQGPRWVLDDIVRLRGTPKTVEQTIRATAALDTKSTRVCLEQDPGQAGQFEIDYYIHALAGYSVQACRAMKDKVTRYGPVSSQTEHGNVGILMGAKWVEPFIQEQEAFPDGSHDDQADVFSGAFSVLAEPPPSRGVINNAWML